MSRLAKKPIHIPEGVSVSIDGGFVGVKGSKGELAVPVLPGVAAEISADSARVTRTGEDKQSKANTGTMWSLVKNAIQGVSEGFSKKLEIEGVGYRAQKDGDALVISLGYVNSVRFPIPAGVEVSVEKNVIAVSGIDKELVGRVAAEIRALKKPEPYKGKGIRYQGEVVRRKAGKKAVTSGS
jgi:large subunit ribosomal protein L6